MENNVCPYKKLQEYFERLTKVANLQTPPDLHDLKMEEWIRTLTIEQGAVLTIGELLTIFKLFKFGPEQIFTTVYSTLEEGICVLERLKNREIESN